MTDEDYVRREVNSLANDMLAWLKTRGFTDPRGFVLAAASVADHSVRALKSNGVVWWTNDEAAKLFAGTMTELDKMNQTITHQGTETIQ